jgi:hypothetical protein
MLRSPSSSVIMLLIGTLFLYPLLAPTPHRIDEAHFQLIAEGMTEAEAGAIFGAPAGAYDWARPQTDMIWLVADCGGAAVSNAGRTRPSHGAKRM